MPDPSPEHLAELLALADTDAAIRRNRVILDDLPEQRRLEALTEQVAGLRQRRADIGLERDAAAAVARKHDRDVAQLNERLAQEQQRMYEGSITNAKQLNKLEAEIAAVQARIDEHELAELEALETIDEHEDAMLAIDEELEGLAETRVEVEAARDRAAADLLAEIAEHEVVRDAHRADLPDDLLARYDESAARHRGNAVGRLDGERCTACGIGLSYADVNDLYEGPPLATCPSCGRLLVVE
jgi:predicted  nucleic acid-binding Zn-ribbon protein